MRLPYFLLLSFFAAGTLVNAQNPGDALLGVWLNNEGSAKIEFYKSGNSYSGKIVWLAQPNGPDGKPFIDKKNPDPAKRQQKVLGLTLITGLKFSNGKYSDGTIYAPKHGQYTNCSIKLSGSRELRITATKGMLSETKTWTKQ
jgi:uncharacterized protein (DUF2147 family)